MKEQTEEGNVITISPTDLECPDSPLRKHSSPVSSITSGVVRLVELMADVLLNKSTHGTGISAVQIGVPIRLILLNHARVPGTEIVLVNPVPILVSGRRFVRREGCLSLPDYHGEVERRDKISVKSQNLKGEEFAYSTSGYEATVLQHELDHLDGVLYWDRMDGHKKPKLRCSKEIPDECQS